MLYMIKPTQRMQPTMHMHL